MIRQPRHHRRHHHPHRHPRRRQPPDHLQPPRRQRRPRLHPPRKPRIQRCHRHPHPQQPLGRHRRQQVQVPLHQRPLGGDGQRVIAARQHLHHLAHHAPLRLAGLIGIGIRPDGNRCHPIPPRPQLARQHRPDPGPRDQPRLEIQPRRQVQKGMAGPRETIDAAMLAAPIGVHRPVEGQVRRPVETQRRSRPLHPHLGAQQMRLHRLPAIGDALHPMRLEPPRRIRQRPPRPHAPPRQDPAPLFHAPVHAAD